MWMAVEVEVLCRWRPDPLLVCRLAGWDMRTVLDVEQVDAVLVESEENVWLARWGTAVSAQVVELAQAVYGDEWRDFCYGCSAPVS
jgi:hypothetical protein